MEIQLFFLSFFLVIGVFFGIVHLIAYFRNRILKNAIISGIFWIITSALTVSLVFYLMNPKSFAGTISAVFITFTSLLILFLVVYSFIPYIRYRRNLKVREETKKSESE